MTVDEVKKRIEEMDTDESNRIISYLRGYVQSWELAEDYLQEAHIEAILRADQIREPDKFASWLMTVAIRKALHDIADNRRMRDAYCRLWYIQQGCVTDDYKSVILSIAVDEALKPFPDHYAIIMKLRYDEQYTFEKIACMVGLEPAAVRQAHSRVCHSLRIRLSGIKL